MKDKNKKTENTDSKVSKPWQFQKGDDPRRNLDGKPKGTKHFSTLFKEVLKEHIKLKDGSKMTIGDAMVKAMTSKAIRGDVSAFNAVADRVDGKAQQSLEVTADLNITNPEAQQTAEEAIASYLNGNH